MLQRFIRLVVVLLAFTFASTAFAQDVKKETKPGVVNAAKSDVKKQAKPVTMKYVSCTQSGCGFWAKSHSAKELRYIMKRHAKKYHKTELTDKQLKDMVKIEGAK